MRKIKKDKFEVLKNVFYYPNTSWETQDIELQNIFFKIELTNPTKTEFETISINNNIISILTFVEWLYSNDLGDFKFILNIKKTENFGILHKKWFDKVITIEKI
jgi:hypothetical protein